MADSIQLVIFDLMGTLVVDDGVVDRAYERALLHTGAERGSEAFDDTIVKMRALRGRPTLDVLKNVLGDPVLAEEATWAFDDGVLSEIATLEPVAGAESVLEQLLDRSVATAVTTSFGSDVRKAILDHLGWSNRFRAEMSAHGVRRGHPAPDLLLEAILDLGIDSVGQVAIVGDTVADLEAGNRAGAGLVVGVLTGTHDRVTLETAPHTHLIESVADLPPILDAPHDGGHRRRAD